MTVNDVKTEILDRLDRAGRPLSIDAMLGSTKGDEQLFRSAIDELNQGLIIEIKHGYVRRRM